MLKINVKKVVFLFCFLTVQSLMFTGQSHAQSGSDFSAQLMDNRFNVCIGVAQASVQAGDNVQTSACTSTPDSHQIFDFTQVPNQSDTYSIRARHSALCLAVAADLSQNGISIIQDNCVTSDTQYFTLNNDGGLYGINTGVGNGSKVLDASAVLEADGVSRNLIQWTDQAKGNQRWTLMTLTDTPINIDTDGDNIIDSEDPFPLDADNDIDGDSVSGHIDNCPSDSNADQMDSDGDTIGNVCDPVDNNVDNTGSDFSAQLMDNRFSVCIEVAQASVQAGDNVQTSTCTSTPDSHQIFDFTLVPNQSDTYSIRARHSALCLAVAADSSLNGINIIQDNCVNTDTQHFRLNNDGGLYGINTGGGNGSKVLDASAVLEVDGVTRNLIQWTDGAKGNQRWNLLTLTDNATDTDGDNIIDSEDLFPLDADNDIDEDGVSGHIDNCPSISNTDQMDGDSDTIGDVCDPVDNTVDNTDTDGDNIIDSEDPFPLDADNDSDGDGVSGHLDNCPSVSNTNQMDGDGDTIGDVCDPVDNTVDNTGADFSAQLMDNRFNVCIEVAQASVQAGVNVQAAACSITPEPHQIFDFTQVPDQPDTYTIQARHSGLCLAVGADTSQNGISISQDNCVNTNTQHFTLNNDDGDYGINTGAGDGSKVLDASAVLEADGVSRNLIQWTDGAKGNQRWTLMTLTNTPINIDTDGDNIIDSEDPFPLDADNDLDGDGVSGHTDNCPSVSNTDQMDSDDDTIGDVCDPVDNTVDSIDTDGDNIIDSEDPFPLDADNDLDGDGVSGHTDNCPSVSNADQMDSDDDTIGDVCDPVDNTVDNTGSDFSAQLMDNRFNVCVEVAQASVQAGDNVKASTCPSTPDSHQIFEFTQVPDQSDTYTIRARHSALCLTVEDNFGQNGSSIIQEYCVNTDNQHFTLNNDGGVYGINTGASNGSKVLDASAVLEADGVSRNLLQWTDQAKGNQRWNLITVAGEDPVTPITRLKIMSIGDSITEGVKGEVSYRREFANMLSATSCNFEMVGSQTVNPPRHEGYSGHRADHFITGATFNNRTNPGINTLLDNSNPDVILMHLGTNDIRAGQSVSSTITDIETIVAAINTHDPASTILVANVIPWFRDLDGSGLKDDPSPDMNALTAAIEASGGDTSSGKLGSYGNLYLVDVHQNFFYTDMHFTGTEFEGLHPGPGGEVHIARAFFQKFMQSDACVNHTSAP